MTGSLRALLVASLLFNVFAVSALGGGLAVLAVQHRVARHARTIAFRPIRVAGEELPAADRLAFRQTIHDAIIAGSALRRAGQRERAEAAALFRATPFDPAAVAAALDRSRASDDAFQHGIDGAAIDFAARLPPDERAVLARGLEHGGPLRHPRAMSEPPP